MSVLNTILTDEEVTALLYKGLSNYEKLIIAMATIKQRQPHAIITCEEVAEFIHGDRTKIRGIRPMLSSIKRRYPDFPDHMIEKSKNSRDIREGLLAETCRELGLVQ